MRVPSAVTCLLLVCTGAGHLVADDSFLEQLHLTNGRIWLDIKNQTVKAVYLLGLVDQLKLNTMDKLDAIYTTAASADLSGADFNTEMSKGWALGFMVGDYVKVLDLLYAQPENLPIPIVFAVRYYATVKLRGDATAAELEGTLISIRKTVNKLLLPETGTPPAIPPGFEIEKPPPPAPLAK